MADYFGREYLLILDKPEVGGLEIKDLRISFKINKSLVGFPNLAEISIYNLKEENRNRFKEDSKVELYAGYKNNIKLIFKGEIRNFHNEYAKPDHITHVFAGDASKTLKTAKVNKTLGKGSTTETLYNELISNLDGVSKGVTDGLKDCITNKRSILKSIILSGSVKKWLDLISETCGFDYSINDNIIETVAKNKAMNDEPTLLINQNNGLIGIPEITEIGVDIQMFLRPEVKLGRTFKFNSLSTKINVGNLLFREVRKSTNNNTYRINSIEHIGDTRAKDWSTSLEGMKI
ncbi:MAG: hypothetical protein U9Q29_02775 [Campylobacterota bacterium]|nr:hypothetical protein [Campylobacterota bacterium]